MELLLEQLPSLAGIVALLGLSGFFSGSESALMLLSRPEIKRMAQGSFSERVAHALLQDSRRLLATILVGNMFANVMLTALCGSVLDEGVRRLVPGLRWCGLELGEAGWRRLSEALSLGLSVALVTPLLMVFGELSPKSWAFRHHAALARFSAVPLLYIGRLLAPALWALRGVVLVLRRLLRIPRGRDWDMLTSDEVSAMLAAGRAGGATSQQEKELLERLVRFGRIEVKEIMVPRTQVVGLDDRLTLLEAGAAVRASTHNYLPVYHADFDDIWGVVSYAEALAWKDRPDSARALAEFRPALEEGGRPGLPVREIDYAPSVARIDRVLEDMLRRNQRFLAVVGEYGGTLGILTINDVLAEILGRFSTGHGRFDYLHPREDGSCLADGRISLRKLRDDLDEDDLGGEADRLGGRIMEALGRLPVVGDQIATRKYRYTVMRMQDKRVGMVRITPLESAGRTPPGGEAAPC